MREEVDREGGKEGRLAERVGECVRLTASNCALLSRQCLRETERERPRPHHDLNFSKAGRPFQLTSYF